ncbi:MAG TPA: mechanosensitive ion channel family protein [Chthoniobacterales bacterium]|nr:mechanosensitive ion channel family protein [Chthoniobacterales bacterium]
MDLSLIFAGAIVADVVVLKLIPQSQRVARFVCMSVFFAIDTVLIVALIGSPLSPVYRVKDLPREFWLQILACCWWALAARELIAFLKLLTRLRKTAAENKLLFDVIASSIYVCSALAMMGFVFGWALQGVLATSGIIAIVLGLALQSTLSDLFSGISLTIEKPYELGDEILLEGGIEGQVIQVNWRSTRLRNAANDVVVIPNSAIAKMRIQNHTAGSKRYSASLTVTVDARNDPDFTMEILKQAAMTCPAILEHPPCTVAPTELKGDRITYEICFSTSLFTAGGDARSQLIAQLYKRARPVATQRESVPIFLFPEKEVLDHLPFLEPLTPSEKADLNAKIIRRPFKRGEQLLAQGEKTELVHFIYSGVIQVTRQVPDGRILNLGRLGPGDTYGEISLLTGADSSGTCVALTSGLLLESKSEDLKPILEARPELIESLSHIVGKMEQLVTRFDQSAIQPAAIEPRDLLWRIKNFFRLKVEDRLK